MSEKNNTPPEIIPGDRHPDYKGDPGWWSSYSPKPR